LTNWKSRGIPLEGAKKISLYINKSVDWITSGNNQDIAPIKQSSNNGVVEVEHLSAVAGMGSLISLDLEHDSEITTIELTKQYISSNLRSITNPDNLKIINAIGDSMKGVFDSGDCLFIDTGIREFVTETTYCIHFDGSLWIKLIQRDGKGGYTIKSANDLFDDVSVSKGDKTFKIVGMVVGKMSFGRI